MQAPKNLRYCLFNGGGSSFVTPFVIRQMDLYGGGRILLLVVGGNENAGLSLYLLKIPPIPRNGGRVQVGCRLIQKHSPNIGK